MVAAEERATAQRPQTLGERVQAAMADSAAARRLSDDELECVHSMGQSLMRAGRLDKALSLLLVCALYRPHNARYLLAVGLCHRRLGRDIEALQALALATSMDPMNYDAALLCAECLLRLRRTDEARKVLAALAECGRVVPQAKTHGARAQALLDLLGRAA